MSWLGKLLSADNSEIDFKAVLAAIAFLVALGMYLAYGIKGLLQQWDMPPAIRDISIALILGGGTGAAATLLNTRLGVSAPCEPKEDNHGKPGEPETSGTGFCSTDHD